MEFITGYVTVEENSGGRDKYSVSWHVQMQSMSSGILYRVQIPFDWDVLRIMLSRLTRRAKANKELHSMAQFSSVKKMEGLSERISSAIRL